MFGHRYSIMRSAVFGSMMLPVGLGLALLAGDGFAVALIVVVAYGMSNGLKAVQRATLPLALFGRAQFGAYMGRLALPQGIVAAISPPAMAAVMSQFGTPAALWLSSASPWSRWSPWSCWPGSAARSVRRALARRLSAARVKNSAHRGNGRSRRPRRSPSWTPT